MKKKTAQETEVQKLQARIDSLLDQVADLKWEREGQQRAAEDLEASIRREAVLQDRLDEMQKYMLTEVARGAKETRAVEQDNAMLSRRAAELLDGLNTAGKLISAVAGATTSSLTDAADSRRARQAAREDRVYSARTRLNAANVRLNAINAVLKILRDYAVPATAVRAVHAESERAQKAADEAMREHRLVIASTFDKTETPA